MGNSNSSNNNHSGHESVSNGGSNAIHTNIDFINKLDSIISNYILSMDFKNLKKLYDKEYCNKLVGLTADILKRRFSEDELKLIKKRIVGSDISESTNDKESLCIYISKYYIKIAHLFSAILTTINPVYTYIDSKGDTITKKFYEKDQIPKDAVIEQVNSGLCDTKINALSDAPLENSNTKINTCYFNIFSKSSMLSDEPGIPELKDLYYDADYDLKTGEFKGMSVETAKQYNKDVQQFYKTFTQESIVPASIQSFSDIKLKKYSNNCDIKKEKGEKEKSGSDEGNKLLSDYANNIRNMLTTVSEKQNKLLHILNQIFLSDKNNIQINPDLTEDTLDHLIETSRALIVELYLTCETDFLEGIKIYEAIVELQMLKTLEGQINVLEKEKDALYSI